jgi:hypothetical protein
MKKLWDLKKLFSHLEPEGQVWARHHHGSDMPTSARAILHHTDQKGPNIMHPSVCVEGRLSNFPTVTYHGPLFLACFGTLPLQTEMYIIAISLRRGRPHF